MVFNLLTNVIIWVYDTLKSVRGKPDYTIIDTSMEYYTNEIIPDEDTLDDFGSKSMMNGMVLRCHITNHLMT